MDTQNMNKPKVSIIIPVYNVEQYVEQCISSACNQTYKDIEIIVVDDGSTDNSGIICDRLSQNDSRIKVIHKKNGGLVSARKAGLDNSTGDFIYPLDGDDWIDSETIQVLLEDAYKYDSDVVLSGLIQEYHDHRIEIKEFFNGAFDLSDYNSKIYKNFFVKEDSNLERGLRCNLCSRLFKKEVIFHAQMNVDDNIVNGEDDACFFEALLSSQRIYFDDGVYYHYRMRDTSLSKQNRKENLDQLAILEQTISDSVKQHKMYSVLGNQLSRYMLIRFNSYLSRKYGNSFRPHYYFPYDLIKPNSKIIIYGMGAVGTSYLRQILENEYCDVVAVVDKNRQGSLWGKEIHKINTIKDVHFDYIVLAAYYDEVLNQMMDEVIDLVGTEKIICRKAKKSEFFYQLS